MANRNVDCIGRGQKARAGALSARLFFLFWRREGCPAWRSAKKLKFSPQKRLHVAALLRSGVAISSFKQRPMSPGARVPWS